MKKSILYISLILVFLNLFFLKFIHSETFQENTTVQNPKTVFEVKQSMRSLFRYKEGDQTYWLFTSEQELRLYQEQSNGVFKLLSYYKGDAQDHFISVSSILNSKGQRQVLVSNIRHAQASSLRFEISNQTDLSLKQKNIPFLIRALTKQDQEIILAERFLGRLEEKKTLFEMKLSEKGLEISKEFKSPKGASIFSLSFFSDENSKKSLAFYSATGFLKIYQFDEKADEWKSVWGSSDNYLNSLNCIQIEQKNILNQVELTQTCFSNAPLVFENKIIVSKNNTALKGVVGVKDIAKNSTLTALKKEDGKYREWLVYPKQDGAVVDFQLDWDQKKFYVLYWSKEKGFLNSFVNYDSTLALYNLP